MTTIHKSNRAGERGNVLFLILIAVALFAALSYAVTQSTRSGSGDSSGEKNLIGSAQLAQYPAGVRTAVVRMILGGVPVEELRFDPPSSYTTGDYSSNPELLKYNVFHPTGGGAIFQAAPADVLAPGFSGEWIFSSQFQIEGVGSTEASAGTTGNDIIAFLPGVTQSVCRKLNDELGIIDNTATNKIPANLGGGMSSYAEPVGMGGISPNVTGINVSFVGTIGSTGPSLEGQPFGCSMVGTTYVYYHVLVER